MSFRNAVVNPEDATLEDCEVILERMRVRVAADVFVGGVINGEMAGEFDADFRVYEAFVGAKMRFAIDDRNDDRAQGLCRDVRDMDGCDFAAAFDQGHDGFFLGWAFALAVLGLSADIRPSAPTELAL